MVVSSGTGPGMRSSCWNMHRMVVLKHMHLAGHSSRTAAEDGKDDAIRSSSSSSVVLGTATQRRRTCTIGRVIVRTDRVRARASRGKITHRWAGARTRSVRALPSHVPQDHRKRSARGVATVVVVVVDRYGPASCSSVFFFSFSPSFSGREPLFGRFVCFLCVLFFLPLAHAVIMIIVTRILYAWEPRIRVNICLAESRVLQQIIIFTKCNRSGSSSSNSAVVLNYIYILHIYYTRIVRGRVKNYIHDESRLENQCHLSYNIRARHHTQTTSLIFF